MYGIATCLFYLFCIILIIGEEHVWCNSCKLIVYILLINYVMTDILWCIGRHELFCIVVVAVGVWYTLNNSFVLFLYMEI
jgi:hypothetical protein